MSVGWDELNYDLRSIGSSRDDIKAALAPVFPERKPNAIAGWAGIIHRFVYDMQVGDVVVAPYKPDSTINLGVIVGPYGFVADAPTHRHRRPVRWQKLGVQRTVFTQPALYEVGAFLTVFSIKRHAAEFRAVLAASGNTVDSATAAVEEVLPTIPDETVDEPRVSRIERHTRDFVLDRLKSDLGHREFEEFTADLLRAMGYQARVTAYTQDGGVDVIAHKDPLGIEPPLIKVQCKHTTNAIGAPDVQQLLGTLAQDELGLFVTLGAFSREAHGIERANRRLRLVGGEDLVDLVLQHYSKLTAQWRLRIPLATVLAVDDSADR
ncbi:restriction endonuclease [Kribbella sp. NPDC056345]|uniref:restriction endonuclease n=1 Tax=Kribbella sp. NPDC056345 TaxID=3345789 RepID=UPI0035DD03DC